MKIRAALPVLVALAAVAVSLFFAAGDLRWIGHAVIGATTLGSSAVQTVIGAVLARRILRPPALSRLALHRRFGIVIGCLMTAAFSYGLWMVISDRVRPLNSIHGLTGLVLVMLAGAQIISGLSLRKPPAKTVHRWNGYVIASILLLQAALGVISSPLLGSEYPRYTIRWLTLVDETWRPDGRIDTSEYFFSRSLDEGNYEISYRSDGEYIYVGLRVKTTGWVGVGISAGEAMRNADIVYSYVTGDGKVVVTDHFGVARGSHALDTELGGTDDIVAFGGKEEGGFTTIEFKRALVTEDAYDISFVEGLQTVIWAYGANDDLGMHTAQGYIDVMLRLR